MNVPGTLQSAASEAYERLAPFYDAYTDHPSYSGWVRRLETLARRHGLCGRRALDVGCGTGKSAQPLLELGYDVVGCDPSPGMLAAAAAKLDGRVRLIHGGLPELPAVGRFDYVTCLNDVLNYLSVRDLRAGLKALAAVLAPGGVFLADTSTVALYRELYARDHVRSRGGRVFLWSSATPPDVGAGALARAWLDVFAQANDGRYERSSAEQIQQHHPEEVVEAALEGAGLELAGRYGQRDDGFPEAPLEPTRHTKCIWVARKP